MTAVLNFNPETHIYSIDGKTVPSVTQIISAVGLYEFDYISRESLAVAAERGRIVHDITAMHDRGELDESTVDEELAGYYAAYVAWLKESNYPAPTRIEEKVYSAQYNYAGTLDRGFADGSVLDIKTGKKTAVTGLQLSAYFLAQQTSTVGKPKDLIGLYLERDGTYEAVRYQYEPFAWLAVLADYQWRAKNNLIKEIWQ